MRISQSLASICTCTAVLFFSETVAAFETGHDLLRASVRNEAFRAYVSRIMEGHMLTSALNQIPQTACPAAETTRQELLYSTHLACSTLATNPSSCASGRCGRASPETESTFTLAPGSMENREHPNDFDGCSWIQFYRRIGGSPPPPGYHTGGCLGENSGASGRGDGSPTGGINNPRLVGTAGHHISATETMANTVLDSVSRTSFTIPSFRF